MNMLKFTQTLLSYVKQHLHGEDGSLRVSAAEEVKTDDVARLPCLSTSPAVISMRIKLCFDI